MVNSLEYLEEKFRRVEEANERRAVDETDLSQSELVDPSIEQRKHHRKQCISVTQFGQHSDEQGDSSYSPTSASLSAAASRSTFYHTLTNPRSLESLISENSEDETWYTEDNHVTEVERIAGRQTLSKSVGALLPRRLPRSRSQTLHVPKEKSMVIDVSVEHTTSGAPYSQAEAKSKTSMVYAARPSRRRAATLGIVSHGSLMERAKDFARKLRRKSRSDPPLDVATGRYSGTWDACSDIESELPEDDPSCC